MLTGQTHWNLCLLATTLKPSAYECVVSSHAKTGLSKQGTDRFFGVAITFRDWDVPGLQQHLDGWYIKLNVVTK